MSNTEETNKLSTEEFINDTITQLPLDYLELIEIMESFASMRVDQAKKGWEKEKDIYAASQVAIAIQTMSNKKY